MSLSGLGFEVVLVVGLRGVNLWGSVWGVRRLRWWLWSSSWARPSSDEGPLRWSGMPHLLRLVLAGVSLGRQALGWRVGSFCRETAEHFFWGQG